MGNDIIQIDTVLLWLELMFTLVCLYYTLRIQSYLGWGPLSWLALAFEYSTLLGVLTIFNDVLSASIDFTGLDFFFHIFGAVGFYQLARAVKQSKEGLSSSTLPNYTANMTDTDKAIQKFWKKVQKKPNVVGYSGKLKPKITRDAQGNPVEDHTKLVVRVYVSKKMAKEELSTQDMIPASIRNGRDEIETDVVEIGEIKALGCYDIPPDVTATAADGRKDRHRPLVIGPSAMGVWPGSTACTLGGFAINKKEGEEEFVGIIANNHCCAQENKATKGRYYIQPSPYDRGKDPADRVATLWRFVEIKFNGFVCPYRNTLHSIWRRIVSQNIINNVDIGFNKLIDGIEYSNTVHTVGVIHGKRDAIVGDIVSKFGRTTGLTTGGRVMDTDWGGSVKYSRGTVFFRDCVLVTGDKFSQGGDSSSFTFTQEPDNRQYIGNLFAGSDTHSIICKYSNVESRLEVEVLIGGNDIVEP